MSKPYVPIIALVIEAEYRELTADERWRVVEEVKRCREYIKRLIAVEGRRDEHPPIRTTCFLRTTSGPLPDVSLP